MTGIVENISRINGFVMVNTDYGYTVFELLEDCDIYLGDEIFGDLDSNGEVKLKNLRTNEQMDVYVQGIQCSKEFALGLLNC